MGLEKLKGLFGDKDDDEQYIGGEDEYYNENESIKEADSYIDEDIYLFHYLKLHILHLHF